MAKGDYLTKPRFGKPIDAIEQKAADWLEANCGCYGEEVMKSLAGLIRSFPSVHSDGRVRLVDQNGTEVVGAGPACACCKQIPTPDCDNPACAFRDSGWCRHCGCGNDVLGYNHLQGCKYDPATPTRPMRCEGCDQNFADPPSKLCPGCQAYRDHQS